MGDGHEGCCWAPRDEMDSASVVHAAPEVLIVTLLLAKGRRNTSKVHMLASGSSSRQSIPFAGNVEGI